MIKPGDILKDVLSARIAKNRKYSVRSFARDLSLSPSYVSHVMLGRKKLSIQRATQIADKLNFSLSEKEYFIRACALMGLRPSIRKVLTQDLIDQDNDPFSEFATAEYDKSLVLKQWYHLPILDLTTCKDFKSSTSWIAGRLGISIMAANEAIERLQRLGLLTDRNGMLEKTNKKILFRTQKSESSIRDFHKQMAELAIKTLETKTSEEDFNLRSITGMTMAINPKHLPRAKKIIAKFQVEISNFLTRGDCTAVHQLGVHLFPLTATGN